LSRKTNLAGAFACVLALSCGSHEDSGSDLGSDPEWGTGFSTRVSDAGDPDAPSSVQQACALFGGPPYLYPSIDALQSKLARRWVGCGDNPARAASFWPAGFDGIQFDGVGGWVALVRAADGTIAPASAGNAAGTYDVMPFPDDDSGQYAASFIMHVAPPGTDSASFEQWEGNIEESPDILFVESSTTSDAFRFSSAPP
jgi:hypothetical protein